MPYKKKLVPATTENVTEGIINQLNADGHYAVRINNAAVYDPTKGVFRRTRRDQKGISDILACLVPRVCTYVERCEIDKSVDPEQYSRISAGFFVSIEVKTGDDKQRKDQKKHETRIREAGGVYLIVKTYPDFLKWYETSIFKP